MKVLLMLSVITIAVVACGDDDEIDQSVLHSLIVPGEEIAGIKLGDDLEKVTDLYGDPILEFRPEWYNADNSDWEYAHDWSDIGVTVFFNRTGKAVEIGVRTPNRSYTEGGNGIGSTWEEVDDEFGEIGKLHITSGQGGVYFGDGGRTDYFDAYEDLGIEFRYSITPFKVVQIVIFNRDR